MTALPPAPYPDGTPADWASDLLPQDVRGGASITRYSNGDFLFHSRPWQTIHGDAVAVRDDHGAFMAWGALLPDGRRVHCRCSGEPGRITHGPWRRRSDNGRSWVVGQIRFTSADIFFDDGYPGLQAPQTEADPFSRAMAGRPHFLEQLRDDSFAWTLNGDLRVGALCTDDGLVGWEPGSDEAAEAIARLRGFWETWADFKSADAYPALPRMPREIIEDALAAAGWRYQTDDDYRRLSPHSRRDSRST
jgi:hypothetical protein